MKYIPHMKYIGVRVGDKIFEILCPKLWRMLYLSGVEILKVAPLLSNTLPHLH